LYRPAGDSLKAISAEGLARCPPLDAVGFGMIRV